MSKKIVAASSIVAVLGVTWVGTTWYSGHRVEGIYQQYIQQFNQETLSPVSFKLTSFERGFVRSKANWEMTYVLDPCHPNDKITLAGYDNINQGFIPSLGWASIDSHIIWPDALQAKVKEIFGDKEALQIYSRINLLGHLNTTLKSPAVTWSNQTANINWDGLEGDIRVSNAGKLAFDVKAPKLVVTSAVSNSSQFAVERIRYQGEQQSAQTLLPVGDASFEIHAIDLSNAGQQLAFKNIVFKNSNTMKDKLLSATGDYKIKTIELNKKNIGDFKTSFVLNNLNADAMKQTYQAFAQLKKQCNPSSTQLLQAFKPVLKQGVTLKLDTFDLKLFDGHATSKVSLTIPALSDADFNSSEQLAQKVDASALLNISNPLLAGVLKEVNQLKGEPISAAEASQHVEILLQGYVERSWLNKTVDGFQAAFTMKAGELTLNGKPLASSQTPMPAVKPTL